MEGEEKSGEERRGDWVPTFRGSPSLHPEEMEEEEETWFLCTGLFTHSAVRPLEY